MRTKNVLVAVTLALGCGSGVSEGSKPTDLPVLDMGITDTHACAIRAADGTVWCWGENSMGELGDGTTTHRPSPVMVAGIVDAVQVKVRERTGCARLGSGAVKCWGSGRPDPLSKVGEPVLTIERKSERRKEFILLPATEIPFQGDRI